VYAQYVPRTLRHVRDNLARHRRFDRLGEILTDMLPELRNAGPDGPTLRDDAITPSSKFEVRPSTRSGRRERVERRS
jgi:hypothetical protein